MAPNYNARGRGSGRRIDRRPAQQQRRASPASNLRPDGHISDSEFEKKVTEHDLTLQRTYGHARDSPVWREFMGIIYRQHGRDIPWADQEANTSDTSTGSDSLASSPIQEATDLVEADAVAASNGAEKFETKDSVKGSPSADEAILQKVDSIQDGLQAFSWADDAEEQHQANGASATGDRFAPNDESTSTKDNEKAEHTNTTAQTTQPAQPDHVGQTSQPRSTSSSPTFGGLYASRHADPNFALAFKEETEAAQTAAAAPNDGGGKSTGPVEATQAANAGPPNGLSSTPATVGGSYASGHAHPSFTFSSAKENEAQTAAAAEEQKDAQTTVQEQSSESSEPTPEEKAEREWQEVELPKWRRFLELKREETYEKYGATMTGSAALAVEPTSAVPTLVTAPTSAPVQQGRDQGRDRGRGGNNGAENGFGAVQNRGRVDVRSRGQAGNTFGVNEHANGGRGNAPAGNGFGATPGTGKENRHNGQGRNIFGENTGGRGRGRGNGSGNRDGKYRQGGGGGGGRGRGRDRAQRN